MQKFVYEDATKVYFGEGAASEHLAEAASGYGKKVMMACGGGFAKRTDKSSGKKNNRKLEMILSQADRYVGYCFNRPAVYAKGLVANLKMMQAPYRL